MERTVTVTGRGEARVVPDRARLYVAVVHHAPGVVEAIAGVDSGMEAAGRVARRFTTEDRIASRGLHVRSHFDHQGRGSGFEASHDLVIECDDLTTAGELVTALAEAVGERLRIHSIGLEASDPGPATVAAREAAFADARSRAEHLAGLGEAELGAVVSMSEGGAQVPLAAESFTEASLSSVRFEPGESAVQATVTVTWLLA